MQTKIKDVCDALRSIARECEKYSQNQSPDEPMISRRGWHHPAITPNEIINIPIQLAETIAKINPDAFKYLDELLIESIPNRLMLLKDQQNISHLFNGNAQQALAPFLATMDWVEKAFSPVIGFENLDDPGVPKKLKRRITAIIKRVESLELETQNMEKIAKEIQQAHEAADSLPTDLAELRLARKELEKSYREMTTLIDDAEARTEIISAQSVTAEKLLQDSENAYSITITKGLSGSFHRRAVWTRFAMCTWLIVLCVALVFGYKIGSDRLQMLSELIAKGKPDLELIVIQLILSLIGLGAPIWLAWLSTKQIGQNSRLSEDYNYKASFAKAYEGYRREAARIDPAMEARLLHAALNQLDESPLRHIDESYHSTPWQELIASPEFQDAIQKVPQLKNLFLNIVNKSVPERMKK